MATFSESTVEDATLSWLAELDYSELHGPEIAPDEPAVERASLGEAILPERLRVALGRLNPNIPAEALDEVFRKLTLTESPSLIVNNRSLHRLLVDGIAVEYQQPSPRPSPRGRGSEEEDLEGRFAPTKPSPQPSPRGRGVQEEESEGSSLLCPLPSPLPKGEGVRKRWNTSDGMTLCVSSILTIRTRTTGWR